MRYSKDQAIHRAAESLIRAGWHYRRGTKHGVLRKAGMPILTVPGTPSDVQSALNFRAAARRFLKASSETDSISSRHRGGHSPEHEDRRS